MRPGVAIRVLLLAGVLAAPAVGRADPDSGVDAQLYRPAFDPGGLLSLEGARGLARHDFSLKLGVSFVQNPLKLAVPGIGAASGDTEADSVLSSVLDLRFTAAFGVSDRLTFGFDVGLVQSDPADGYGQRGLYRRQGSDRSTGLISLRPLSNIDPSGGFTDEELDGPVDARLALKYRLPAGKKLAAAAMAIVSVPFGDEQMFLGDQSFVFEPKIALEYGMGSARLLANVGARFRKRTVLEAYDAGNAALDTTDALVVMDLGSELLAGAGVVYAAASRLSIMAEATLYVPLPVGLSWGDCRRYSGARCSSIDDADYFAGGGYGNPAAEALLGGQYRATPDVSVAVAGGAGLLGDGRSEDFRVLAGVTWAPTPAGTRAIGRGDRDSDEVPDATDVCPDDPEDRDGFQDDDGCPDLDNDGDGIIDAQDACADEPEDKDGYEDEDGCPERDNDGDGVPDVTDRCPGDKEDFDQFEDDDGCPEEDNDGDGIADAKDRCPNDAETVNGLDDLDGCPDQRVKGGPLLGEDRIDLRGDRIVFAGADSDKLTRGSQDVLDAIAVIMKGSAGASFRVEVHVALGTRSKNAARIRAAQRDDKQVSQRRADAIRRYLLGKGVDPALQAVGLGSERPIVQPATEPANERVDFIRVRQAQ